MHIELVGLPGSGKTTAVNQLIPDYDISTYSDYTEYILSLNKPQKYLLVFCGGVKYFNLVKLVECASKSNNVKFPQTISMISKMLFYIQTTEVFVKKSKKIVVLDQGIFQYLCNLSCEICKSMEERTQFLYAALNCLDRKSSFTSNLIYYNQTIECASLRAGKRAGKYAYDLLNESERREKYTDFKQTYDMASREYRSFFVSYSEVNDKNAKDTLIAIIDEHYN